MTIPVWVLLGFAVWTLLVLMLTVGVYRWALILTGRVPISEWRADGQQGSEWYRRAMRAHANCVENLPVYGAIVVVIVAAGLHDLWLDRLAIMLFAARVAHTAVHVAFEQTNAVAGIRFAFFFTQVLCLLGMAAVILART
jgi:uncharacterized membrane protein YecN with MAPEG domain